MNPYHYILPTTQQHQQFYFFMYHVLQNLAFLPTDLWGVGCGRRILPTGYEISQITDYQWSQHQVLPTSQRSTDGPASSGGVTPLSPLGLGGVDRDIMIWYFFYQQKWVHTRRGSRLQRSMLLQKSDFTFVTR